MGGFIAVLFTTAYAPMELLAGWLKVIATLNPVTLVLQGVRQGFVGSVTWHDTWPALLAVAGLLAVLGSWATHRLNRVGD
jgi:ABC-type polysaccharide/polyol phosphate export permease